MKARGITLSEVATRMRNERTKGIGVSQPSLSGMLNGNIPFSKVEEIAGIIGVSMAELVSNGNEAKREARCPHCGKPISVSVELS